MTMKSKDLEEFCLNLDKPTEEALKQLFRVETRAKLFTRLLELNQTGTVNL